MAARYMTAKVIPWHVSSSVATKFQLGGWILTGGGHSQVGGNHLTPNSDFYLDFPHFILEILKNLKILAYIQKFFFKNGEFRGDIPPGILNRGGHVPTIPPGGDAHACVP